MRRLEMFADALLRSATARWIGLAVGLGALGFMVARLWADRADAVVWVTTLTAVDIVAFVAGFGVYHLGSIVTLRLLRARPALSIWTAAQLVKYLPVPGSAVIGMVGSTVRHGGSTRQGLGFIIRHSLLHVAAASVVGSAGIAAVAQRQVAVPTAVTVGACLLGAAGVGWAALRHLPVRRATVAAGLAVATWAGLGALLGLGFLSDGGPWWLLAVAYPAGWVAGQLALPVPAGIGVREVALLLLLTPVVGETGAITFAFATRLLHLASDGTLVAIRLSRGGVTRLQDVGAADDVDKP